VIERRGVVEYRLNDVQGTLVVVIVGLVTGNRFDRLPRIAHGKGVTNKLQHFRIVTAVADGYALLRGDVPAFQQAADAVGFMQAFLMFRWPPRLGCW
jgi:hypothetical protein